METTCTKAKPKLNARTTQKLKNVRAKVREQVIALLGKPDDLWRLDVHLYQGGKARVNVWQRQMARPEKKGGFMGSMGKPELTEVTQINDSFYVRISKTAIIESANPEIQRRY